MQPGRSGAYPRHRPQREESRHPPDPLERETLSSFLNAGKNLLKLTATYATRLRGPTKGTTNSPKLVCDTYSCPKTARGPDSIIRNKESTPQNTSQKYTAASIDKHEVPQDTCLLHGDLATCNDLSWSAPQQATPLLAQCWCPPSTCLLLASRDLATCSVLSWSAPQQATPLLAQCWCPPSGARASQLDH